VKFLISFIALVWFDLLSSQVPHDSCYGDSENGIAARTENCEDREWS